MKKPLISKLLKHKLLFSLILILSLNSCVETIVVGTVAGSQFALRDKDLNDTVDDLNITSKIVEKFTFAGLKNPGNAIDVMVNEKRVLLTGIVSDEKLAKKANELAWKVGGVIEVIDEIQVAKNGSSLNGFRTYAQDAIITSQIESRGFFTRNISLVNVKINTVNGVVYLLGIAKNEREINKVTGFIASIKGVQKVVSHVIIADDERRA